ncbi:hypothetical protein Tco_0403821 [Tanacetum coccineum]
MYDGESLQSSKLIIDSPDYEEILEDAEEKIPIEQTYLSTPSTSNVTSESSKEMSNLPMKKAISECFANTNYGFFLGKKVAYPVVANYVRNTWGKYGLVRSMFSSSTRFFSFQFSSMDGLDAMLEHGPWFIRNNPLILKK